MAIRSKTIARGFNPMGGGFQTLDVTESEDMYINTETMGKGYRRMHIWTQVDSVHEAISFKENLNPPGIFLAQDSDVMVMDLCVQHAHDRS